jgi:hypothetical protein
MTRIMRCSMAHHQKNKEINIIFYPEAARIIKLALPPGVSILKDTNNLLLLAS